MKKNKLFMLGLVAVFVGILSLTLVSSTFAKYTSNGSIGAETVRVAKWGVTIEAVGDLFLKEYKKDDTSVTDTNIVNTVVADTEVIAPGTTKNVTLTVNGKSEVAVNVKYEYEVALSGWEIDGENDTKEIYFPLDIKIGEKSVSFDESISLEEYKTAIETAIKTEIGETDKNYAVGTELENVLKISWEWPFEGNDDKDTALGSLETAPTITLRVTAAVTQID